MKINFIIIFILFSLIDNSSVFYPATTHLVKDKSIIVPSSKNGFIFDSESYGEGEHIYFKITANKFNDDDIKFEFLDENPETAPFTKNRKQSPEMRKDVKDAYDEDVWSGEGKTYYYVIDKHKNYLENNIKGKFLAVYYDVTAPNGSLVQNYHRNKNTVIAIIVAVIVVVIVVVVIVVCCIRRKKRLAAEKNNMNVYNGNNVNVNNYPNQGNYGPQTYNQNPNYNNNMNMNMNMNQGPYGPHGPHGPHGPYGNNNMGYNNVPYANNPQQYSGIPQNSNTMRYG